MTALLTERHCLLFIPQSHPKEYQTKCRSLPSEANVTEGIRVKIKPEIPKGFGQIGKLALSQSVAELNPPQPITIEECNSVQSAIETMQSYRIGCAVIVDEDGRLSGIVTERDILLKWSLSPADPKTTTVKEIMTPEPQVIKPSDSIAAALYWMSNGGFRHLPLIDEHGLPTGIISVKDVMDYISLEFMRNLVHTPQEA